MKIAVYDTHDNRRPRLVDVSVVHDDPERYRTIEDEMYVAEQGIRTAQEHINERLTQISRKQVEVDRTDGQAVSRFERDKVYLESQIAYYEKQLAECAADVRQHRALLAKAEQVLSVPA